MRTALCLVMAGVIVAAGRHDVPLAARQSAQEQQPVFRTGASAVTVPVSIKSNGTAVSGLTPADFVVLDNGTPQTVEVVSGEAVAADVTLVVETSEAMAPYVKSIENQVRKIVSMMRPDDRIEVIGVSTYVEELLPLRPAAEQRDIPTLKPGGLCAINDALVGALLREPDAARPHLVIALTDTIDTMSMASMQSVREAAKYSSSILTIAWITMDLTPGMPPGTSTSSERSEIHGRVATAITHPPIKLFGGIEMEPTGALGSNRRTEPATGGWLPHYDPPRGRRITAFDPLKDAAEMTGGKLYLPGVFVDRNASAIFDKLYSDYRHRYVLRYSLGGAAAEGWHEITVTVPKIPKAEIDAKRGYFVDKK